MKELLFAVTADDCNWSYFTAGGKGGQHQNKTASACRCVHKASKAEGISRDLKSQWQNRKLAFQRMADSDKFKAWMKIETSRRLLSSEEKAAQERAREDWIEKQMNPENIRVEMLSDNKWIPYSENEEES